MSLDAVYSQLLWQSESQYDLDQKEFRKRDTKHVQSEKSIYVCHSIQLE